MLADYVLELFDADPGSEMLIEARTPTAIAIVSLHRIEHHVIFRAWEGWQNG